VSSDSPIGYLYGIPYKKSTAKGSAGIIAFTGRFVKVLSNVSIQPDFKK
jgi:hypothetical protein